MINYKLYDLLLGHHITEKSSIASEANKEYTFKVCGKASKVSIKSAVEKIFDVKVLSVNIINSPSKQRVFKGRKGNKVGFKKAMVRVDKNIEINLSTSN